MVPVLTYTAPWPTTGESSAGDAVHNGWQVFGAPVQFVTPAASNAYSEPPAVT